MTFYSADIYVNIICVKVRYVKELTSCLKLHDRSLLGNNR